MTTVLIDPHWLGVILIVASIFILPGFFLVNPNEAKVLLLFGEYKGTAKDNGFFWANPFFTKKMINLIKPSKDIGVYNAYGKVGK